jgi:hypothetical protein
MLAGPDDAELFELRESFATNVAQDRAAWAYAKRRESPEEKRAAEAAMEIAAEERRAKEWEQAKEDASELPQGSWFEGAVGTVTRGVRSRVESGPR